MDSGGGGAGGRGGRGARQTARDMLGHMLSSEAAASATATAALNKMLTEPLRGGRDRVRARSNWEASPPLEGVARIAPGERDPDGSAHVSRLQAGEGRCEVSLWAVGHDRVRLQRLSFRSDARKVEVYADGQYTCTLSGTPVDDGGGGGGCDGQVRLGSGRLLRFALEGSAVQDPVGEIKLRFLSLQNRQQVAVGGLELAALGKKGQVGCGAEQPTASTASTAPTVAGDGGGLGGSDAGSSATLLLFQRSMVTMAATFERQIAGLDLKLDRLGAKLESLDERVRDQASAASHRTGTSSSTGDGLGAQQQQQQEPALKAKLDLLFSKLDSLEGAVQTMSARQHHTTPSSK